MPRRLEVSLNADGTISAEASGTPGPDCLEAIDQLRAILEADVIDSKPTPEFSTSAIPLVDAAQEVITLNEERA